MRYLPTLACLLLAAPSHAAPGAGTLADPVVVDAFPYAIAATTVGADAAIDSYDCSAASDETGPEVVYRFELPAAARVMAWVEGDGGGVDIDVHLLDTLDITSGVASDCAARGNVIAEAEMVAGEHWIVVDSFNGDAQAGDYVLHLEAIGDAWIERPIAVGVSWRARRYADLNGSQIVHALVVDTSVDMVELRAIAANGCQTVGDLGFASGAVAGINGGYFGGGCAPVSLLIESGALVSTNASTRGAFGLSSDMVPMVAMVDAGQDWPAAHEAHGGGPILVAAGVANQGAAAWADQGFTSASFNGNNPRTFAGIDGAGRTHLVTVDGRRANAVGMSLDDLAAFAQGAEIGALEVVNLDGGGSTTMWVDGLTPNGVLNYPSDATQEDATHPGSRPNSGGFFVFAPAYNHAPRFQTVPITDASAGAEYSYDADAIDLDVDDIVSFALLDAPDDMTIDAMTGIVNYAPTAASPPSAEVVIEASDDAGASSEQSYTLLIEGGLGAGGSGGNAGDGGSGAAGSRGGQDGDSGCGCSAPGQRPHGHAWLLFLLACAAVTLTRSVPTSGAARGRR